MKKIIILTGILLSTLSRAEIWEPPPYQPDENHLPPEERQEEPKAAEDSHDEEKEDNEKVREDKKSREEYPGRPLFPIK